MIRSVREVREVPGLGSTFYARRLCESKNENGVRELLLNDGPGTSGTSVTEGPISLSFGSSKGPERPSYVCENPFNGRAGSLALVSHLNGLSVASRGRSRRR